VIRGLVFDLDGTLADTERLHWQAYRDVLLEHGVHGSNAALIAHHVLDTFFAKKEGRQLPEKPQLKANLAP